MSPSPKKSATTPPIERNGANGIIIFRAALPCRANRRIEGTIATFQVLETTGAPQGGMLAVDAHPLVVR